MTDVRHHHWLMPPPRGGHNNKFNGIIKLAFVYLQSSCSLLPFWCQTLTVPTPDNTRFMHLHYCCLWSMLKLCTQCLYTIHFVMQCSLMHTFCYGGGGEVLVMDSWCKRVTKVTCWSSETSINSIVQIISNCLSFTHCLKIIYQHRSVILINLQSMTETIIWLTSQVTHMFLSQ